MRLSFFLFVFFPLLGNAQENSTVKWVEDKSLEQAKALAKQENKYVFVDCYATWCGPCKMMDKNVYSDKAVAAMLNEKFVSVKVQMDSTKVDAEQIKALYADARRIRQEYNVIAYPSFLFFSPDGKLVHRDFGFKDANDFVVLLSLAENGNKQYFALIEKYFNGYKDYSNMISLIKMSGQFGYRDTALMIAKDYKANWLEKVEKVELMNKDIIDFYLMFPTLLDSKNRFFELCFHHQQTIDSIGKEKGTALKFINYIIGREEIWDKLLKDKKPISNDPEWDEITSSIKLKYGVQFATALVPAAKLRYYKIIKDWSKFAMVKDEQIMQEPPKRRGGLLDGNSTWYLNTDAWTVFLECGDSVVLSKALNWIDIAIKLDQPKPNVQYLDTRANLLYKLGRVQEAIDQEQQAIEQDDATAVTSGKTKGFFHDEYASTVLKIKNGEPTWNAP